MTRCKQNQCELQDLQLALFKAWRARQDYMETHPECVRCMQEQMTLALINPETPSIN